MISHAAASGANFPTFVISAYNFHLKPNQQPAVTGRLMLAASPVCEFAKDEYI